MKVNQRALRVLAPDHIAMEIACAAKGAGGRGQHPSRLFQDTTIHRSASSDPLGGLLKSANKGQIAWDSSSLQDPA